MQIVNFDFVLDRDGAEFIRRAISHSGFHATARHPDREATRVVIAPDTFFLRNIIVIRGGRASEFSGPNHQCIL